MASMPDGHGSVAAVVVTYNRKDYLERLLPSLLASQRPLDAIYVVDNNSTDGTAAIASQYGVPVVKEPQQGVCAARQRGVDCAKG